MRYLRKKQVFLLMVVGIALCLFGHAAHADVISAGLPSFTQQGQSPADFVKSLYDYALGIVAGAAVIMIVYGGVKYVASGGNAAAKGDALDIIKNAIFGVVLLLGGFIILYTINPELVNLKNPTVPNVPTLPSNSGSSSGARTGDCVITATPSSGPSPLAVALSSDVDAAASFSWTFGDGSAGSSDGSPSHTFQNNGIYTVSLGTILADPTGGGNDTTHSCTLQITVGSQAGGQCQPPASGPCSLAALQGSCFGSNAQIAGGVCMIESSGNPMAQSGTDKCADGSPVSIGLFQINISANTISGLNCPTAFDHAFSGSHPTCNVTNRALYLQCLSAAQSASDNIAKACELSGNGSSWRLWGPATIQKCGL
ncbi:MAG: PKD domain-containing protein [Candidatus Paceibacterota bacterium]